MGWVNESHIHGANKSKQKSIKFNVKGNINMLKMSFFDGTLDRAKAKAFILTSQKPCIYTHGLGYRGPSTHRVPISTDRALQIIENECLLDITEEDKAIHLNTYSGNDMW